MLEDPPVEPVGLRPGLPERLRERTALEDERDPEHDVGPEYDVSSLGLEQLVVTPCQTETTAPADEEADGGEHRPDVGLAAVAERGARRGAAASACRR